MWIEQIVLVICDCVSDGTTPDMLCEDNVGLDVELSVEDRYMKWSRVLGRMCQGGEEKKKEGMKEGEG